MPLYHFHLRTEAGVERDEDGLTFPDLDAAYLEAYDTVPALAEEMLRRGHNPLRCAFVIADADDRPLLELPFRERVRGAAALSRPHARAASCHTERAGHLLRAVREQHAELRANLDRMRALIAESGQGGPR